MIQLVIYLFVYLSIIYSVILLAKKNRTTSDVILAVWLMFVALNYSIWQVRWQLPFGFIHCVFSYLYIKCTINNDGFKAKYLLHFIPAVIALFMTAFYDHIAFARENVFFRFGTAILFQSVYFAASIRLLLKYRKQYKENASSGRPPLFGWLSLNVGIAIFFHIINVFPPVVYYSSGIYIQRTTIFIVSLILLNCMGLIALRMNLIFRKEPQPAKTKNYSTYNMKETEIAALENKLKSIMETEQLYLVPELSLKDLCDKLDVSSHHLSYVLNMQFNQNFYEFVNGYRLEAVKNELVNPMNKHLSIFAIACDCGFNSQSTFNRIFKQKVGMSPSKFREEYLATT